MIQALLAPRSPRLPQLKTPLSQISPENSWVLSPVFFHGCLVHGLGASTGSILHTFGGELSVEQERERGKSGEVEKGNGIA